MRLERFANNPILSPHPDHPWEDLAVFNPAAWYEETTGEVLLFVFALTIESIDDITIGHNEVHLVGPLTQTE